MNPISQYLARPTALVATGLALLLGAASCTTAHVGVSNDFDHAVNFRAYKTWAWYPRQTGDTQGGPAKGYESFVDQRIRAAVSADLGNKGLTEAAQGQAPDVFVAYTARVENKQEVSPYYGGYPYGGYGYGYGGFGRGYGGVTQYKAGTVIIDIVDARRKELAWRGTGMAQLNQNNITQEEATRIVTGILETYPPTDNQVRR